MNANPSTKKYVDMNSKRAFYCLLLLIAILQLPVTAQMGNNPCAPIDLMMLNPDPSVTVLEIGNNVGASNDPIALPDCGSPNQSQYFSFMLPPGYSHFQVQYTPLDGQPGEISLFDQNLCGLPTGSFTGLDACGAPGQPLLLTNEGTSVCLADMQPYLIRVSGVGGEFALDISTIPPNCFDGCQNGNEIAVDVLPPIDIATSSGDSTICIGDVLGTKSRSCSSRGKFSMVYR